MSDTVKVEVPISQQAPTPPQPPPNPIDALIKRIKGVVRRSWDAAASGAICGWLGYQYGKGADLPEWSTVASTLGLILGGVAVLLVARKTK